MLSTCLAAGTGENVLQLKGMTWDHPRGYDPLAAASQAWEARTGVAISWDRRSLQDFETFSVRVLAERYDLIVIDHPHVGQVAAENCLLPFDEGAADVQAIARASLGESYPSYHWAGCQWALPIDAAAQVQAWRPDRLDAPLTDWAAMMELAARGGVAIPLRPPHSLMSLYTLYGLLGGTPSVAGPLLFEQGLAEKAYRALALLADQVDARCFDEDPIAILERMAETDGALVMSPLIYGYVSYALEGFRPARIAFADLPAIDAVGPRGSALGGTGIAVSALRGHGAEAAAFARWVAGGEAQAGLYAEAGGQPGHGDAWAAEAVNRPVLDFYRATRRTLDLAWVRPRHDGYMAFQQAASDRLNDGLRRGEPGATVVADLNRLFGETL